MKSMKPFFFGIIFGIALGLWFGVNIGKHKPFYSNPFAPASIEGVLRDQGASIIEQSGKALGKGAQSLEEQGSKIRKKMNP